MFWRPWHEQTQREQHSCTHMTHQQSHGCTHAAQKSETRRRAAQLHNSFSTYWCSDLLLLTFNLFMSIMSRPEILNPFSPQKPRPLKLTTFAYKSKMSSPIIFNHCHPKTPTTVLLFISGGNMFWFRFHIKKNYLHDRNTLHHVLFSLVMLAISRPVTNYVSAVSTAVRWPDLYC